jgi:hypothetical protein
MNVRSLVAQTKKLGDIALFAYGESTHVAIDIDCDKHLSYDKPTLAYRVYVASVGTSLKEPIVYKAMEWKEVLALITWLEDIEIKMSFRNS